MSPKKKKTQKLRQELSEYTSLIRALHTASTQDLLPHLIGAFPPPPPSSRSTFIHPSKSFGASSTGVSKNQNGPGSEDDVRDIWTRWPLLREDVYVPEWTLRDEVRSIAEKSAREWLQVYSSGEEPSAGSLSALQKMDIDGDEEPPNGSEDVAMVDQMAVSSPRRSTSISDNNDKVLPLPEEDILTKGVLSGLALDSSTLLSQVFASLAAHRPSVDPGLQNRLRAMDWKSAFSVIGSAGIFDQRIMQDVQTQMERIHSESDRRVLGRLEVHGIAKRKLRDLEESLGTQVDPLHFTRLRKKRRKVSPGHEKSSPRIKEASNEEVSLVSFGRQKVQ